MNSNNSDITLSQYMEALANIITKCVAFIFTIAWAVVAGILKGLTAFPVIKHLKTAIDNEVKHMDD